MPGEDIYSWSTTAASNGSADTSINWLEGQARASVNNSARAMMAAHAKERDYQNASITTTGSANAQAFNSGVGYSTVPTGMRVLLRIGFTNTGAATLAMDGILPAPIKNQAGDDISGGELIAGSRAEFIYDGVNWVLLYTPGAGAWTTGDAKLTFKTVADLGWILCDDGSIGNATSGATTRAHADTEELFTLFYTNISALVVQDSAGATVTRGASAAADYTANRRLVIPAVLGRSIAGAGAGAGLTARALGSNAGAETATLTVGNLPYHDHSLPYGDAGINLGGLSGAGNIYVVQSNGTNHSTYTGGPTGATNTPLNILDPTIYMNVMVKL